MLIPFIVTRERLVAMGTGAVVADSSMRELFMISLLGLSREDFLAELAIELSGLMTGFMHFQLVHVNKAHTTRLANKVSVVIVHMLQ